MRASNVQIRRDRLDRQEQLQKLETTDLAIGKNPQWKNLVNMGRKNNQSFVQIPHAKLISMLTQKLEKIGITVKVGEESYREHPTFLNGSKVLAVNPYIL